MTIKPAIGVLQAILTDITAFGVVTLLVRIGAVMIPGDAFVNIVAIDTAATVTTVASAGVTAFGICASGVAVAVVLP